MPYLTGDSSITPRMIIDGAWHIVVSCGKCRRITGPALRAQPWPRFHDTPLIDIYGRLRCSAQVEQGGRLVKCGGRVVELTVSRMTGRGSQMEEVLRLTERME